MAAFLRRNAGGGTFLKQQWYNMVEYVGGNSSVLGFFVEQVLLSYIEKEGMILDGIKIPGMASAAFRILPQIPQNAAESPVLYVPDAYNYKAIDGLIMSVDITDGRRVLEIMPLQITINNNHEDSEAAFFEGWDRFSVKALGENSFNDLKIVFLWIVEDSAIFPRKDAAVAARTITTRNGTYSSPSYVRKVRSVKYISETVGQKLSLARERGGKDKIGRKKPLARGGAGGEDEEPGVKRTRSTIAAKKKGAGNKKDGSEKDGSEKKDGGKKDGSEKKGGSKKKGEQAKIKKGVRKAANK